MSAASLRLRRLPTWMVAAVTLLIGVAAAWLARSLFGRDEPLVFPAPDALAAFFGAEPGAMLRVAHPDHLWLAPLATVVFLVAMVARSLVDQRALQLGANTLLRLAVIASLGLTLAGPSLLTPIRGKTVVFVVDTSASIDAGQLTAARNLVQTALDAARDEVDRDVDRADRTRLRLVTYAEQAEAHALDGDDPLAAITRAEHPLASRHAEALALATALFDPETEPNVVLITDGAGDLAERQALSASLSDLRQRGIRVHTQSFPAAAVDDVAIAAMHLPETLRIGQTVDVVVDLVAARPGSLRLFVEQNGEPNELAPSVDVELRGGEQQVKVPARLTKAGAVTLAARIDPDSVDPAHNRTRDNDHGAVAGEVRGRPRVLHVGSDTTRALVRALTADHLDVDDVSPGQVPEASAELAGYDLVIFSDVPARSVSTSRQRAVVEYVRELGGGFMMIGGENAFGVGGWGNTPIEGILPVRFEGERQREEPTLALMLVIDKSGSMSSEDKLDLVKEAAHLTARTLDPSDEIGVVAFDSRAHVLVRLQRAANKIRISSDIRRLTAGGGTNVLPALREAFLQLSGSRALVKHVILLSDGQSPERGIPSLLHEMRSADITVSTVGVGAGAGKDFLSRIAEQGRGRYYFSEDGTDVPRIFSRETREVSRNAVVEQQHFAKVNKSVQALRGVDFGRAPGLTGMVPIDAKPQSETLLRTQSGEDLLVRGRSGLGRTLAFASDAKPRWAARWLTWSGFPKLWSQLARDTMRQGKGLVGGATIVVRNGTRPGAYEAIVDVEASEGFANGLRGELEVVDLTRGEDEEGRSEKVGLELVAPGRYLARLDGILGGQRLFRAQMFDASVEPARLAAEAVEQLSIPYPPELLPVVREGVGFGGAGGGGSGGLWGAAWREGTLDGGDVAQVVARAGEASGRTRENPLWGWVLWLVTVPLFVGDLLVRRVQWGRRVVG